MSITRKGAKGLALLAGGALALSACSTGSSSESDSTASGGEDVTITAGYEQEFSAYNNNTSGNNALKNQIVLNQVLPSFWEFGPDGEVRPVDDFGSYEKTSDEPLTVKYTISDEAVWSDGDPIDCDDIVMQWAAMSGKFTDAAFDPASTSGFERMQQPQCAEGDKEVTIVYDEPYADWVAAIGGPTANLLPAHIVEQQAGVESIVDAATNNDSASMAKAAEFWNNGWSFAPGDLNTDTIPSSGPYVIDAWKAGDSITLKANPEWWGEAPKASTVVIRFVAQDAQAQALQNGEIQIAEPQPNPDVLDQLAAAGDGIKVLKGDQFAFEHLDFNFTGQFADATLRQAFASCVPRQEIVDKLIIPVNPDAKVLQSRLMFPFQPGYDDLAAAVTDGAYDTANLDAARQLMNGRTNVPVRIGHIVPNQRRTDTVALIKASCDQVGFDVQDIGSATFFDDGGGLDSGDFDVALFAWIGSSLVSGNSSIYTTDGGQNKGHYSSATIDGLMPQLEEATDKDEQHQLMTQIDKTLWDDLATIPLFAHPGTAAHASNIDGVVYQPAQTQIEWNMQQWAVTS
ncbi:MAG: ABC transporter family substrate-binding protein [Actinomycetales bacterium]